MSSLPLAKVRQTGKDSVLLSANDILDARWTMRVDLYGAGIEVCLLLERCGELTRIAYQPRNPCRYRRLRSHDSRCSFVKILLDVSVVLGSMPRLGERRTSENMLST
ncbi:hypothetical protein FOQG_16616 [Fusarium oxysporum f. sp. raphani 54005]|uniref:Uncharacterized protein n=1 Tax=Fusarium oxysporum f. sp. raphani 54005 TaxID=1089458 RepID=X0BAD9_FUSOX|nr:hypothetical protein FOQG_16616 [Fusarium oxysporum f. sp. raphani 54005]